MDVVFNSVDRKHLHLVRSRNTAEVGQEPFLQRWRDESAPLFGTEYAMHKATRKRMHVRTPFVP
jgi:hypothetical protein